MLASLGAGFLMLFLGVGALALVWLLLRAGRWLARAFWLWMYGDGPGRPW